MKTIGIKTSTWKELKKIQLDEDLPTLDATIKLLIDKKYSIDKGEY